MAKDQSLYRKDGLFALNVGYYLQWFEFLAMSPSYELARRYRNSQWGPKERAAAPSDFSRVLAVYDDLGDVQNQTFRTWWLTRAFDYFGYPGRRPHVEQIAFIGLATQEQYFSERADKFVEESWDAQGLQNTMIVAIPVGLPRAIISRHINKMLDGIPENSRTLRYGAQPKYPMRDVNLHRSTYFLYLKMLWFRCAFPTMPLWELGTRSKVSDKYRGDIDPVLDADRHSMVELKDRVKILTHRAVHRGKMMAENAARGTFPSHEKCPNAVAFDLEQLNKMRELRRKKLAGLRAAGRTAK